MTNTDCITALITALDQQVWAARELARDACTAELKGNRNRAIGTLLPAVQHLANAADLLRVILALHRTGGQP